MSRTAHTTRLLAVGSGLALASAVSMGGAQAATAPASIGTPNGITGVQQTIEVRAPEFANQTVAVTVNAGSTPVGSIPIAVNAAGSGSAEWTPPGAGTWSIAGQGTLAAATPSNFTVAPTPTRTTLYAANQAQINAPTTMVAVVQALAGSLAPQGSVTFTTAIGTVLQTVALTPGSAGTSTATYSWTSTGTGTTTITATYNPASGVAGQADMTTSAGTDTIESVDSNPLVTLRLPSTFTVGVPVVVSAVINNIGLDGSAAFTTNINGTVLSVSGSVPLVNSVATAPWTPTVSGNQVLTANFSASNSNASGTANQWIAVANALPRDTVRLAPAGQNPWPGAPIPVRTNTQIAMAAATASGAPVSIEENGPCLVSGMTLITATAPGTCTLVVSSPGTTSFAPASATYSFQITAPAKKKRR